MGDLKIEDVFKDNSFQLSLNNGKKKKLNSRR